MLELNSNPSLNMYLEIEKPDGVSIKLISEIDKYVKYLVMQNTIKIVKCSAQVNSILI